MLEDLISGFDNAFLSVGHSRFLHFVLKGSGDGCRDCQRIACRNKINIISQVIRDEGEYIIPSAIGTLMNLLADSCLQIFNLNLA